MKVGDLLRLNPASHTVREFCQQSGVDVRKVYEIISFDSVGNPECVIIPGKLMAIAPGYYILEED